MNVSLKCFYSILAILPKAIPSVTCYTAVWVSRTTTKYFPESLMYKIKECWYKSSLKLIIFSIKRLGNLCLRGTYKKIMKAGIAHSDYTTKKLYEIKCRTLSFLRKDLFHTPEQLEERCCPYQSIQTSTAHQPTTTQPTQPEIQMRHKDTCWRQATLWA